MVLEKHKFQSYTNEEDKKEGKVFTIRLSASELEELKADMKMLRQTKAGTSFKALWKVGRNVLHDKKTGIIYGILLDNLRKNDRQGIGDVKPYIEQM